MCAKKLPQGKLPIDVLKPMLHSMVGNDLVVPPDIGIDVGITKSRGKYLVSSSDPITGAVERIGWHAVNVSANDVATSGIMPDTLNIVALFPEGTNLSEINRVMKDVNRTASSLGISVAGGHTEITPKLHRIILMVTAIGSGDAYVTSGDAVENDSILLTKTAGIEGTSILAKLPEVARLVEPPTRKRAENLINKLSIMKEASSAFATGKVHAMHDVTEGGVIGSVLEMSLASKLGFEIFGDIVPRDESTKEICTKLKVDPLRLIGSGSLLIACAKGDASEIMQKLKLAKIRCTEIGTFLPSSKGRWLESDGKRGRLRADSIQDELWPALGKYGNFS
ncbi:MAG: AIR synthase-related protein [Thaumarchaeota archaeon]|nr:AIR synthase-related protein [Nitrososphaerota archaeon]